jgi:hypothetical protein
VKTGRPQFSFIPRRAVRRQIVCSVGFRRSHQAINGLLTSTLQMVGKCQNCTLGASQEGGLL